jgi:hypothetical protein
MDTAHQKEEENTKEMENPDGLMEKCKKKVKLHHRRTPLPRHKHRIKERFPHKNIWKERRCAPIIPI